MNTVKLARHNGTLPSIQQAINRCGKACKTHKHQIELGHSIILHKKLYTQCADTAINLIQNDLCIALGII